MVFGKKLIWENNNLGPLDLELLTPYQNNIC